MSYANIEHCGSEVKRTILNKQILKHRSIDFFKIPLRIQSDVERRTHSKPSADKMLKRMKEHIVQVFRVSKGPYLHLRSPAAKQNALGLGLFKKAVVTP